MAKKASKKKSVKKTAKKAAKKTTKKAAKKVSKPALIAPSVEEHTIETIPHETKPNINNRDKWFSLAFIAGLILIIVLIIVLVPLTNNSQEAMETQGAEALLEGPYIAMDISDENPKLGDSVQLRIRGENLEDLAGYQLSVYYNPEVLSYESMTNGAFLGVMGERICIPPVPKGNSIQNIGCVKLPETPGQLSGVSGSGELATINFKVTGRGDANIKLDNILMPKSDKTQLDYQVAPFEPLTIK